MTVWSYSQKMIEKEGCSNCRRLLDRMKSEKTLFHRRLKVVEILKEFLYEKHEIFFEGKKRELADFKMKCQKDREEVRQHLLNNIEKCEVYYAERNEKNLRLNDALKDVANYKFLSDQSFAKAKDLEAENARLRSQWAIANKKRGKKRKKEPLGSPDEGLELSDGLSSVGSPFIEPSYETAKLPSPLSHCDDCMKIIMDRHICGKGSEEAELAPLFLTSSQPLRASTPLKELSMSVEDYADENHPESPKSAKKRRRRDKNKSEIVNSDTICKEIEDPKSTTPLKENQSTLLSPNYESDICDENIEPAAVLNKTPFNHSSNNNKSVISGNTIVDSEQLENSTQVGANTSIIDMPSIFEDFDSLIEKKLMETSTNFVDSDNFNFDSLEDSIISNKIEGSDPLSTKDKNNFESSQQINKIITPRGDDEVSSQTSFNVPTTPNKTDNEFDAVLEKSNDAHDKLVSLSNIIDVFNNKNDLFLDDELRDLPENSSLPVLYESPVKNKRISRVVEKNKIKQNLDSNCEITHEKTLSMSAQEDIGADLNLSSDEEIEYPDKVIEEKINKKTKPTSFTEPSIKMSMFDLDEDEISLASSREMSPVFFENNDEEEETFTDSSPRQLPIPDILNLVKTEMENFELVSPLKSAKKLQSSHDNYLTKTVPCRDIISKNLAIVDACNEDINEENSEDLNYLDEMPLSLHLSFDDNLDATPLSPCLDGDRSLEVLPSSLQLELSKSEKEIQCFDEADKTLKEEKPNNNFDMTQTLIEESGNIEIASLKLNKKNEIISSKQKADMRNSQMSKLKKHCKTQKAHFQTSLDENIKSPPTIELAENFVNEDLISLGLKPDRDITPPRITYGPDCNETFVDLEDNKAIKTSTIKSESKINTKEINCDDRLNEILEEMLFIPSLLSPLPLGVNCENNLSSSNQRSSEPEILVNKRLVDYSSDSSDSESCLSHSTDSGYINVTSGNNTVNKIKETVIVEKQAEEVNSSPIKSLCKGKLSAIKEIVSPRKDTPTKMILTRQTKENIIRNASPEFKSPKCLAPKKKKSKKRGPSIIEPLGQMKKRGHLVDLKTPRLPNSPVKQTSEVSFDTDDEDFLLFVEGLKQNYQVLSPLAGDVIESNANSTSEESEILVGERNSIMDSVQEEKSCISNVPPDSNSIENKMEDIFIIQNAISQSTECVSKTDYSEETNKITHKESITEEALCDEVSLVKTEVLETNEEDDTRSLLDTSNDLLETDSEESNDRYYICLSPSNDEENLDDIVLKNSNNYQNLLNGKTPIADFKQAEDRVVLMDDENTSDGTNDNVKSKELMINERVSELNKNVVGSILTEPVVSNVEHLESPLSPDVSNSEELENQNDLFMTKIPPIIKCEKELINQSTFNNQTTEQCGIVPSLEETKDVISLPDNECFELNKSENQKFYFKKKKKTGKIQRNFKPENSRLSRLRQFQLCKKLNKTQDITICFEDVCLPSTMEDLIYLSSRNLFDIKENKDVKNILDSLKNISNTNDDVDVRLFEDLDSDSQGERNTSEENISKYHSCFDDTTSDNINSTLNDTIQPFTSNTSENSLIRSKSFIMDFCNKSDNHSDDENLVICEDKTTLPLTSSISVINANVEKEVKILSSVSLPGNVCDFKPVPLSGSIEKKDCLSENLVIDESQFSDHKEQKSDELLLDTNSHIKIGKVDYSAEDRCSKISDPKPWYLKSSTTLLSKNKDLSKSADKSCSDVYQEVGSGINMLASHRNMTCFGKLVSLQYSGKPKSRVSNLYSEVSTLRANNYISFSNKINNSQSSNYPDEIKKSVLEELNTTDDHIKEDFENQSPRKLVKIEAGECKNNTCLSNPAVPFSNKNSALEEKNNGTFEVPKYLKFNFYTEASETEMQSEPCYNTSISDNNVIIKEEGILNEEPSNLKFPETWNIRPQVKSPRLEADMILCKTSAFECSLDYWHDYARLNPKPRAVNLITEKDLQSLENYIKEIMKANNEDNLLEKIQNISLKIDHMDSGHIADMIVDAVFTDNGEADLRFTPPAPPLTPVQRRLLLLVSFLAKGREEYYITVLKACEEPVVSFVDKCSVDKLCNLVQFHTAMCKHLGLLSRSRAFLYDILYCKGQKVYPLVYSMLPLWIEILPSSQESQDCLLTQTIVYLLTHYVPNQKPDTIPYHNSLKQFLDDAYEYGKPVVTRDTLCNKLIDNIRVPGAGLALVLLCKREEWDWASKTMESKLHPIILSWIQDQVDEDTAIQAVLCLGRVVRGYPINVASNSIKRSRDLLESVLKHQKNIDVTEAAVNSICMLRRHDLFSCSVIFTKWRPAEGKITKNMADNIKTVLSAKQLPYWKKFLTRYN